MNIKHLDKHFICILYAWSDTINLGDRKPIILHDYFFSKILDILFRIVANEFTDHKSCRGEAIKCDKLLYLFDYLYYYSLATILCGWQPTLRVATVLCGWQPYFAGGNHTLRVATVPCGLKLFNCKLKFFFAFE